MQLAVLILGFPFLEILFFHIPQVRNYYSRSEDINLLIHLCMHECHKESHEVE